MNNLKELLRSKEEKRILTGTITGIEEEYYKVKNENIPCAIVWYGDIKILIPITHLGTAKQTKSMIRGMLGSEIDFIVIELDENANIGIASRKDAKCFLENPYKNIRKYITEYRRIYWQSNCISKEK